MTDDLELARTVSEAALATEGVYSLSSGKFVEAATYGAGGTVRGVVVRPGEVEVHIVARYQPGKPIPELTNVLIENLAPKTEDRKVVVVVEDLEVDADANL